MVRYTGFLRAINVSGQKIIKMEELRKILAVPGIKNISTYIQSGNVLFDCAGTDANALTAKLEKHLHKQLGYGVELFLRTVPELEDVLRNNPFKDKQVEGTMVYISFLQTIPSEEQIAALTAFNNDTDTFEVIGKELYALVVKDGSKSRFEPKFIEKKLGTLATTRNINTVTKMLQLAIS